MSRLDDIKASRTDPGRWMPGNVADWLIAEVDRLEAVNNGLLMARNSWRADAERLGERVSVLTAENADLRPLVARMAKLGSEPCGDIVNWFAEWADISIACRAAAGVVVSEREPT